MSPLPHQTTAHMMVTTATPAPLSIHSDKKVVTDSAQRKLDRKRANARLRQQRCRARKRAKQQQDADGGGSIVTTTNPHHPHIENTKSDDEEGGSKNKSLQSAKMPSKIAIKPLTTGSRAIPTMHPRYWQPHPPPPPGSQKQMSHGRKPLNQVAPQPSSAGSASSWKHPRQASMYPTMQPHSYYHHHHPHAPPPHHRQHQAYGMPWYTWPQSHYYGQHSMHVPLSSQRHHPSLSGGIAALRPKLPPTSPVQKSPIRPESLSSSGGATTPYHQVEAMVKSPLRSLDNVTTATTPNSKDSLLKIVDASPESGLLPPLWSAVTKPTPVHALQSPWSNSLPSPPLLGSATPTRASTTNSKWSSSKDNHWSSSFHQTTPSLPLTTPIKTSNEMGAWHAASPPSPSFTTS